MNKSVVGIVVALLIVAAAGAGFYLMQNIDGIVKNLIEEAGTESTGTAVTVQSVKVNLGEGSATITGIAVANPEGFSAEPIITMDRVAVTIDTSSLTKPVYVIKTVTVDGYHVLAEQKGTGTNVKALLDAQESAEAAAAAGQSDAEPDIELAIAKVSFLNGNMELRSEQFGSRSVELQDMDFRKLGTPDNGLTTDEVADELASQLFGQVQDAVKSALRKYLAEEAKAKIKEKLGSLFSRD